MGEAILSLLKMPIMLYTRLKKIPLAYISVNNKKNPRIGIKKSGNM